MSTCNNDGISHLLVASKNGHTQVVSLLLQSGVRVSKCHDDGTPPLWVASNNGHTEVVSLLLENGADV